MAAKNNRDALQLALDSYEDFTNAAGDGVTFDQDEIELTAIERQRIHDLEADDKVREMDLKLVENLDTFLHDFLISGRDFTDLAEISFDREDLRNWWLQIHRIVKGEVPAEDLPEYLRDAAARYHPGKGR